VVKLKRKKGFWQTPNIDWRAEDIILAEAIAAGEDDCFTLPDVKLLQTDDGVCHSTSSGRDTDGDWGWEEADFTFPTRRQAIDFHIERARDNFRVRVKEIEAGIKTWRPDEVLPQVREVLAQLEELMTRTQLDLFEA
jgi:hypothetical protein